MIKNKRGFIGVIWFFIILFAILIIGFIGVISVSLLQYASSIITPEMESLGMIEDSTTNINMSEIGQKTFGVLDSTITAFTWLLVIAYVAMLIFSIIFVVSYNYNPNPVYIGVYFMFVVLLIFGCIIMSNMYQDIYTGNDELAKSLQNQSAMNYLILYSPLIMAIFSFLVGIYIFVGKGNQGGTYGI